MPHTLHYEYVSFSHSIRALLTLKIIIKELIDNLGIDSEKLKFVSISTVYEKNNGSKFVETIQRVTPTSNQISTRYHWFRQNIGKEFVIRNIKS